MSAEGGNHGTSIKNRANDDASTSNARSQLSSAQTYLAEVQELLGVVENHIDDSKTSVRRRKLYRRQTAESVPQEQSLQGITRTRTDKYSRLWKTSLKSVIRHLKEETHELDSLTAQADNDINQSGLSKHGDESKHIESEKGSRCFPGSEDAALLLGEEELTGVLKSSKSFNELTSPNKRVSFVDKYDNFITNESNQGSDQETRIPVDPEAIHYTPLPLAAHITTDPKTEDFVERECGTDDQSVLSLFSINAVFDQMSETVKPVIKPDEHVRPAKINNSDKMFKKSLDRPISRRHSAMNPSSEKKTASYSRSKSDGYRVNLDRTTSIPHTASNTTDLKTKDDVGCSVPSLITMGSLKCGTDDQTASSRLPVETDLKNTSKHSVAPAIKPDEHLSLTRINNSNKMFKKSLDRPITRRRSTVSSSRGKNTPS